MSSSHNNNEKSNEDEDEESTQVGLDDFVLLDDFTNEDAFIDNLKIRHEANIVYVNILRVILA